jgi:hypothetical protein
MEPFNNVRNSTHAFPALDRYYKKLELDGGDYHCQVIMEIHRVQPLIISILRAQAEYLNHDEMDEVVKLGCAVWDHFSERQTVRCKQITFDQYTVSFRRNMFSKAAQHEVNEPCSLPQRTAAADILILDIQKRFVSNPILKSMNTYNQSFQIAVLKSLAECLDAL